MPSECRIRGKSDLRNGLRYRFVDKVGCGAGIGWFATIVAVFDCTGPYAKACGLPLFCRRGSYIDGIHRCNVHNTAN